MLRLREGSVTTTWFYLLVVLLIAIPVSLFEVWGIARANVGWGEPLPTDTMWGKPLLIKVPLRIMDPRLLTRYHFVMFVMVVPIALTTLAFSLKAYVAHPPNTVLAWMLFVLACVLGVMVLEDFLFFVFSSMFRSPYPRALARFFRGEANWHPRWINFGIFKLPDTYVWLPAIIMLLLWFASKARK